jgi:TPR repeat protein
MDEAEFNECLDRLAHGRYPSLAGISALERFLDAHPDRRPDYEHAKLESAREAEPASESEEVKDGSAAAPPSAQVTSDDDALEPLQRWPDSVNPALWRSRRALMGDPDRGMPQASAQLQAKYEDGLSFMRANDPVAAGQAFTEAAQEGHPGAIREIAVAAFDDLPKAIVWGVVPLFERAAARGDGRAMSYLGLFCRLKEDDQGALEHYRASDQRGDPEGSRELGILLARLGRVDEGLVAVERARSRGSASGALAQGILLEKNFGDRDGAREAFLAAAEMGHPKGSFHLIDLFISEGNQGAEVRALSRLGRLWSLRFASRMRCSAELGCVEGPGEVFATRK